MVARIAIEEVVGSIAELAPSEQVVEEHIRPVADRLAAVQITILAVLMAHSSSLEELIHIALVET